MCRLGSLALIFLLAGCGGGSNQTPPAPPALTISVSPTTVNIQAGTKIQFSVAVRNTTNQAVTWEVNGTAGGSSTVGSITSAGLFSAPSFVAETNTVTVAASSRADPSKSASALVTLFAAPRIAVRMINSVGEFYDSLTGNTFVPRGNDYLRFAPQTYGGQTSPYHSTFAPDFYDPVRSEAAFKNMQFYGYNVTKVWLSNVAPEGIGNPDGMGLSAAYLSNLTDFLKRAMTHQIFVVLTADDLPVVGGYNAILNPPPGDYNIRWNPMYLTQNGIDANTQFWQDLANGLIAHGAPMDAIFAYQLREELNFRADFPPLSETSGTFTAANGVTYDLSTAASKTQMEQDGLVYWANHIREGIMKVHPNILVGIGFGGWNDTQPHPFPAIVSSNIDFISLDPLDVGGSYTFAQAVLDWGMRGFTEKPIIVGEFEASKSTEATEHDAAVALKSQQIESCTDQFKGWLLWTWDTDEPPNGGWWNALSGSGAINQSLAPVNRSNACAQ